MGLNWKLLERRCSRNQASEAKGDDDGGWGDIGGLFDWLHLSLFDHLRVVSRDLSFDAEVDPTLRRERLHDTFDLGKVPCRLLRPLL